LAQRNGLKTEEGTRAKFHPIGHRCNVSPVLGEKPQSRPKYRRVALRSMLPVTNKATAGELRISANTCCRTTLLGLPLSFLSWAYLLQGIYFWAYGTPGVSISAFSYAKPSHFRRNFRPTRNDEDVGLHCKFEIVRGYMNGRLSVIPGKDVTIENLCYCQTKPTSSKLIHTQTSIRRLLVSLLYVMVALCNRADHYIFALCILLSSFRQKNKIVTDGAKSRTYLRTVQIGPDVRRKAV